MPIQQISSMQALSIVAWHNLPAAAELIIGSISLGIVSMIMMFSMGMSIGGDYNFAVHNGETPSQALMLIIPHGITEYFAFIVIASVEFDLAIFVARKILFESAISPPLTRVGRKIILGSGLLVVSALIEAFITPVVSRAWSNP